MLFGFTLSFIVLYYMGGINSYILSKRFSQILMRSWNLPLGLRRFPSVRLSSFLLSCRHYIQLWRNQKPHILSIALL